MGRDGWRTRIDVETTMRSDRDTFYLTGVVNAFEGETQVTTKRWERAIPRDLV